MMHGQKNIRLPEETLGDFPLNLRFLEKDLGKQL